MWETILGYVSSSSNYGVTNMNNLFNFLLSMMDILNNEQNEELMDKMVIHLGKSFYKKFQKYVITKLPNSDHIQTINRIV